MDWTSEIMGQQWQEMLDRLSRLTSGRPMHLEFVNREFGDQTIGKTLSMVGIWADEGPFGQVSIGISSVEPGEPPREHVVGDPAHIYVRARDGKIIECIGIEDEDGDLTMIWFDQLPALDAGTAATTQPEG